MIPSLVFSQQEVPAQTPWGPRWERAKMLTEKGNYLQAQETYETLLESGNLGAKRRVIQKEYEALRMKMLFSPVATPDSIFHTVVEGDTLYEIAGRYGTTVQLLEKSNGTQGGRIYPGMKLKVSQLRFVVRVDKSENRLELFGNGKRMKRYRVATGEGGSTPAGTFKVTHKLENPTWYHAGLVLSPESPENILGSRWLGFDLKGYGIHGTTLPETIGSHSSKGCVRMFNADVEELYTLLPSGAEVVIQE